MGAEELRNSRGLRDATHFPELGYFVNDVYAVGFLGEIFGLRAH